MLTDREAAPPPVETQREALRHTVLEAPRRWRILFIGQTANSPTDIVPCLRRALEGLGHTVFGLDTGQHGDVLDNPRRVRGGHGPVFVRTERLRPVLDRFRPQVVVLCAAGLVLEEPDATLLKERGALVIGVTLSDPDVQESVLGYAPNLDYHTTNSVLALQRYHAAGQRHTLLLPFGIDRDFVTQRVAPAPDLRADVICLGHAARRPERQAFMAELAGHLSVRCYGVGWPFPGAAPVHGERMVQAAREATFHVNFPGTLAGHTNVKCGVFESVGAGAVLCTSEFEEMRRYFTYGEEILAYDTPAGLAAAVRALSADEIETMRRRAFARLVSEHLYEHRWLQLFRELEADLTGAEPAVGPERAAVLRETLDAGHGRPRVVVVSGFYGAGNVGDDLLLESIAQGVESKVADAQVVVACTRPREVESRQGLPAFDRTHAQVAGDWAARASCVVLGGGGLWHDYSIRQAGGVASLFTGARVSPTSLAQLPLLASLHRRGVHVFGMGVGPLEDPDAQAVVRFTAEHADSVVVRDRESVDLLRGIPGWVVEVEQAPDPVYGYPLPQPVVPDPVRSVPRDLLAVNLRPWARGLTAETLDAVRSAVEDVARAEDLTVVGLPLMATDVEPTRALLEALAPDVARKDPPWSGRPEEVLGVLSRSRALVSMRLHANLLAHRLGVPAVGLAYDPKVRLHFAELGREDHVLDLAEVTDRLPAVLRGAVTAGGLPAGCRERVSELEEAARASLSRLAERIAAHPAPPPPTGRTLVGAPTAPAPAPPGWDAAQVVSPGAGRLSGVNLRTGEPVGVRSGIYAMGIYFAPDKRDLAKGDSVSWTLRLPPSTTGGGRRVELWLRQRHLERADRRGRLAWQLLLDDEVLHEEDTADWGQRICAWVAWPAGSPSLQVRVVARRDLRQLNWGWLAQMNVEAVRCLDWAGTDVRVGVSTPQPVAAADADDLRPTAPPQPAQAGRSRRRRVRSLPRALGRRMRRKVRMGRA